MKQVIYSTFIIITLALGAFSCETESDPIPEEKLTEAELYSDFIGNWEATTMVIGEEEYESKQDFCENKPFTQHDLFFDFRIYEDGDELLYQRRWFCGDGNENTGDVDFEENKILFNIHGGTKEYVGNINNKTLGTMILVFDNDTINYRKK